VNVVIFALHVMNGPVRTLDAGYEPPEERVLVGLIGAGIERSASPLLHEAEADELGIRCLYRLIDLDELGLQPDAVGELLSAAQRLGFRGVNLTYPCKQIALEYLDDLSPTTEALGATNTVVFTGGRAVGYNTDCAGFRQSFTRGLAGVSLGRALLLGAGGAGTAVAHASLRLGIEELVVVDVDVLRAERLALALVSRFGDGRAITAGPDRIEDYLSRVDGLIHATPTGMASHPGVPLPLDLLRPELWVADIVYMPLETALLQRARALGCRTLDGGAMAVFQAADSFQLFTNREPDRERMLRHFAALASSAVETVGR
jgi:shikimate dehydrogenase